MKCFDTLDGEDEMLRGWALNLLEDSEHGMGEVVKTSSTVVLSKELVLKVTNRHEADLLASLNANGDVSGKVPELVATFPSRKVFRNVQIADGEIAVLYKKVKGETLQDILEDALCACMQSDFAENDVFVMRNIVSSAVEAAKGLHAVGFVQQDLWLGNMVCKGDAIVFLDVGDFTPTTPTAATSALGGLLISIVGSLLGLLLGYGDSTFTPRHLWEHLPFPWWVHTHWGSTPSAVTDAKKVTMVRQIAEMVFEHALPQHAVVQAGVVIHLERFIGVRHPVAVALLQKMEAKFRLVSVKRAALMAGIVSKGDISCTISRLRGSSFWTLIRHELGTKSLNEIQEAVKRRHAPAASYFSPCPVVLLPVTPPTRGCTGVLPAGLVLPKMKDLAPAEEHSPSSIRGATHSAIEDEQISNMLTLEQMILCGELGGDLCSRLTKWAGVYGLHFRNDDFSGIL